MEKLSTTVPFARLVRERERSQFEVVGSKVEFLLGPQTGDEDPCVLKATIPSVVVVPLHSHDAIEIFLVLSGSIDVLFESGGEMRWVEAGVGDLLEIPCNAKHAFRNRSQSPMPNLLFTNSKHGRYLREIGRPLAPGEAVRPPDPSAVQHLLETARRHGYWFATPEENASVGINHL